MTAIFNEYLFSFVLIILDDVLVFSKSEEDHEEPPIFKLCLKPYGMQTWNLSQRWANYTKTQLRIWGTKSVPNGFSRWGKNQSTERVEKTGKYYRNKIVHGNLQLLSSIRKGLCRVSRTTTWDREEEPEIHLDTGLSSCFREPENSNDREHGFVASRLQLTIPARYRQKWQQFERSTLKCHRWCWVSSGLCKQSTITSRM